MNYESNEEKSRCLECGDVIEYGRGDKKFCCEACKNKHNNRKTRGKQIFRARILSILEKNYGILNKLLKTEVFSLSVMELKAMGFNFDYFTSYSKVRRHNVLCCFDITYTIIADKVTNITKISPILSSSKYKNT